MQHHVSSPSFTNINHHPMKKFILSFLSTVAIPLLLFAQQTKDEKDATSDYLRNSKELNQIIWHNNPVVKVSLGDLPHFGLLARVQDTAITQVKYSTNLNLKWSTSVWENIDSISPKLSLFTFNDEVKSQFKLGNTLYTILSNIRNDLSPDQIICEWSVNNDSLRLNSILSNVFSTYYGGCNIESVNSISEGKKIIAVRSCGGDGGQIWNSLSFYLYSLPNKMKLLYQENWGEGINEDDSESSVSLHLKIDTIKRTASIKLTERKEKGDIVSNSILLEKVINFDNLMTQQP